MNAGAVKSRISRCGGRWKAFLRFIFEREAGLHPGLASRSAPGGSRATGQPLAMQPRDHAPPAMCCISRPSAIGRVLEHGQKDEGPTPRGMSPSLDALPARPVSDPDRPKSRARRYAAFGFLPGAGAGTYPDTRHCHASIVRTFNLALPLERIGTTSFARRGHRR